ncbi:MAG TPA: glutamyl-tRNA reductase [Chthoniobacterales bacterium]|nr:glutamyl-tRNA reductase [Chthoniobacterales bacterium]
MNLFCVGLSHHNADVETLERFGGNAEIESLLRSSGCAEALLLTTCNRVEVYGASETRVSTLDIARCLDRKIDSPSVRAGLALGYGAASDYISPESAPFYRYEDGQCVRHLFRVVCGIDSMVIGETEILGQAKKAYESARASGSAGRYLHRLFQRAFRVAKHVRTHTNITRGAVSVGSVAVDLAQKIFGDLRNCKVLVLGAGETSEKTARALISRGVTDLRVSNRSAERADNLAQAIAIRAVPFQNWLEQCREVDILVTSTSSEMSLLSRADLEPMLRERIDRPLFIIDIAVPRNVDANVDDLEGVYLYDIDSLQSIAEQSLATRREQIAVAEQIIAEHVAGFDESIARGLNRSAPGAEHPSVGESSLRPSEL